MPADAPPSTPPAAGHRAGRTVRRITRRYRNRERPAFLSSCRRVPYEIGRIRAAAGRADAQGGAVAVVIAERESAAMASVLVRDLRPAVVDRLEARAGRPDWLARRPGLELMTTA